MSRQDTQDAINAIIPAEGWEGAPDSTRVVAALSSVLDFSAPTMRAETLEFTGKGAGSSKTTTTIFGTCVLAEVFGVGDEIFLHWPTPLDLDDTVDVTLNVHWFMDSSVTDKLVSAQLDILSTDGGPSNALGLTGTLTFADMAAPNIAGDRAEANFPILAATYVTGFEDIHLRISRIASSNEHSGGVAVEHVQIIYGINQ